MFEQFSPTNKANWKTQIEKDLKGKPYEALIWQLNDHLSFEPFYTSAELELAAPITNGSSNNWQIAEQITVTNCKQSNAVALESLQGGADALELHIAGNLSAADLSDLFDQIEIPFIAVHFTFNITDIDAVAGFMRQFKELILSKGYDAKEIRGSVSYQMEDNAENWGKIKELLIWSNKELPFFRMLGFESRGEVEIETKLGYIIEHAVLAMDRLTDLKIPVSDIHQNIHFHLLVGKQYFLQIAAIRALKLVWLHIQQAFQINDLALPPISAAFDARDYDENTNTNMIRATTMALSAAIGGVDRMVVMPSDEKGETAFQRRIARNIQHLLKMESYIDRVADPAAGAYYIEKMTNEIAAMVWNKFTAE